MEDAGAGEAAGGERDHGHKRDQQPMPNREPGESAGGHAACSASSLAASGSLGG
jgi:hypothetical protein